MSRESERAPVWPGPPAAIEGQSGRQLVADLKLRMSPYLDWRQGSRPVAQSGGLSGALRPGLEADSLSDFEPELVLRAQGLKRSFGRFKAVDDVNLNVRAGEVLRISGRERSRQDHHHPHPDGHHQG